MNRQQRIYYSVLIVVVSTRFCYAGRTFQPSGFYVEVGQSYSWWDGIMECARRNMSLLTLDSSEIADTLSSVIHDQGKFDNPILWLGASSHATKGVYECISTGASFKLSGDDRQNKCIVFDLTGKGKKGIDCTETHGYVCEPNRHLLEAKKELEDYKVSFYAKKQILDDLKNSPQQLVDKDNQLEELRKMVKMSEDNLKDVGERNKTYERLIKKLDSLQKDLVVLRSTNANHLEKVKYKRKELNEMKKNHDNQIAKNCKDTWQLMIQLKKALEVQMNITTKM
uniref:C-type lectin domain-containing protein n=1 Tax=Stomoxys calcitrans TaxID=35570 RepID=A0A1I8Q1E5_STOCA